MTSDAPKLPTPVVSGTPSLRSGTWVSFLAALLVLAAWLAVGLTWWVWGPVATLPPEDDIEAGGGFALAVTFVLPHLALSLWVLPCALIALAGWLPRLLVGATAPLVAWFGWWLHGPEADPLHRVYPTLGTVATLMACAGVVALVLATTEALARVDSRTARRQPTQSPRPPHEPYDPGRPELRDPR